MRVMSVRVRSIVCAALALAGARTAFAQPVVAGSTAFCLFEVPADDNGKRRWINLGIVQYVEATRTEVKISYGGGAFGSGYDAKIPVPSMEEALTVIEKIRKTAASCR
ncbi:MAG: hypothetical protein A2040_10620 [Rhodocyclales bacterium GWA2_65_19]|nr:MAG: hypothetical protein A2040_10620 [Rhodocyclales bacterium GWA2_65_19]